MKVFAFIQGIKDYDWKGIIKSFLYALVLALIFRSFLFEPYRIPSGSMIPTLQEGDYLFVSKYNYGYSWYSLFPFGPNMVSGRVFFKAPERGDIIIFKLPRDPKTNYIKRLIGLPGDEIQVIQGILYINGKPVPRDKKGRFIVSDKEGREAVYNIYEETLPNSVAYDTLKSNTEATDYFSPDNTPIYKVPPKHYFFMGDNRNNSIDSRYIDKVGYVPEENLVGRAVFLVMTADFSLFDFIKHGETGRAFTRFLYAN